MAAGCGVIMLCVCVCVGIVEDGSGGLTHPRPHELALLWSPSSKKKLCTFFSICGSCA